MAMCQNNFSDAYEHFKSAVQCEPRNTCVSELLFLKFFLIF